MPTGLFDDIVAKEPVKSTGLFDDIVGSPAPVAQPLSAKQKQMQSTPVMPEEGTVSPKVFSLPSSSQPTNPDEELSMMEKIGAAAYDPVLGLSLQPLMQGIGQAATGLMNLPARAWHAATGTPTEEWQLGRDEPVSRLPYQQGRPIVNVPMAHDENVSPLPRVLAQTVEGLTTPENLVTLPIAAGESVPAKLAATVMAPQMAVSAVQSGQKALDPSLSNEERTEEAYRAGISGLMGVGLAKQITKTKGTSYNIAEGETPFVEPPKTQRLGEYAVEKTEATTPQGLGKVPGLNRLVDPRGYRKTPAEQALLAHNAQVHKGQSMTALWLETVKKNERAFPIDEAGQVKLRDGSKGYLSDVVEAEMRSPGSQPLTPKQQQFVGWWKKQWNEVSSELQKEGVKSFLDAEGETVKVGQAYFPRPAIGKVNVDASKGMSPGGKVGSKQFFQRGRVFQTEAEGVKSGIKYEPDEFGRIGRLLTAKDRAIADRRLARDHVLAGRKGTARFMTEGEVYHPAFRGRVFERETAEKLNRYYNDNVSKEFRTLSNVNDFMKAMQFTLDVSAPFNQGLPLMGVNPYRWGKATVNSYKALFNDKVLSNYLNKPENLKAAQDLTQHGSSIGHLGDFLAGTEKGKLASKIAPIRASARSMSTFINVAKVELYKAFEPIATEKGWSKAELAEAVDNAVLSGRMEQIGLSSGRTTAERLIVNAPSYIRGAGNLIAMAGQGKISGKVARRALTGMSVAITGQLLATYYGQGLSEEEIAKRMNPKSTEFARVQYELPNGERVEASYGNILISLARLLGDTVEIAQGEKELKSGQGNPWLRFGTGRLAPWAQTVEAIRSGQDFRGEEQSLTKTLAKTIIPVPLEGLTTKESGQVKAAETAGQFFGLNVYPESFGNRRNRRMNEEAGGDITSKSVNERRAIDKKISQELRGLDRQPTAKQIAGAIEANEERGKRVQARLSDGIQNRLDELKFKIPGYKETQERNNRALRLVGDEKKRFEEIQAQEFERRLKNVFSNPGFDNLSDSAKKRRFEAVVEAAHKSAWAKMRKEINANSRDTSRGE